MLIIDPSEDRRTVWPPEVAIVVLPSRNVVTPRFDTTTAFGTTAVAAGAEATPDTAWARCGLLIAGTDAAGSDTVAGTRFRAATGTAMPAAKKAAAEPQRHPPGARFTAPSSTRFTRRASEFLAGATPCAPIKMPRHS